MTDSENKYQPTIMGAYCRNKILKNSFNHGDHNIKYFQNIIVTYYIY